MQRKTPPLCCTWRASFFGAGSDFWKRVKLTGRQVTYRAAGAHHEPASLCCPRFVPEDVPFVGVRAGKKHRVPHHEKPMVSHHFKRQWSAIKIGWVDRILWHERF